MTRTKFIELLNLYLDHEISLEEAATLEAEIQHNPEHHAIYRQYCQMQRGCAELASGFATEGDPAAARRAFHAPVQKPRIGFNIRLAGTAVAAACAVFTIVTLVRAPAPTAIDLTTSDSPTPRSFASVPQASPIPSVYALSDLGTPGQTLHEVYSPTLVNLTAMPQEKSPIFASADDERFDWMNHVKLAPVENGELTFRVKPVVAEGKRTYHSQRPFDGQVEMTAFQFQR